MPRSNRDEELGPRREPGARSAAHGAEAQGETASARARRTELEGLLGYAFRDRRLLEESMTHRSLLNEIQQEGRRDNERLEFLGDAVLDLVISAHLVATMPEASEGELTVAVLSRALEGFFQMYILR